ncbi:120.7 kDa protein in NOF-FB transposable element, partial [Camponotus floridanus]
IQNGSLLPPIKINKTKIQVLSTCPFDAITEILTTTYVDSVIYKQTVDTKYKDLIFFQIIVQYATNGVNNMFYFERASYLLTLFDEQGSIINCACNISNLINKLLVEAPSFKQRSTCTKCHEEIKNIAIADIDSKPILQEGLHIGLQKSIDIFLSRKDIQCKSCGIKIISEIDADTHVLIDVEHAYHSTLLAKIGFPDAPTNVSLSEIPIHLKIKADNYRLIGIISYDSYAEQEMGHYIAYCYRVINIWEEYDSLKNKCVTVMSHKLVRPSVIAY